MTAKKQQKNDPVIFAELSDPVIEVYKRDVDRTLLREHLKLTPTERAEKFTVFLQELGGLQEAAKRRVVR